MSAAKQSGQKRRITPTPAAPPSVDELVKRVRQGFDDTNARWPGMVQISWNRSWGLALDKNSGTEDPAALRVVHQMCSFSKSFYRLLRSFGKT